MESRTQGSRPRPRTQKKSEAKAKDSFSEDRISRDQEQECSRPRLKTKDTGASVLQKTKKVFKFFFLAISKKKSKKKIFKKLFQAISKRGKQKRSSKIFREVSDFFQQNFNDSKNSAVLEPRTGQFSRTLSFEAKAKDIKMCPRGQGRPRGLHLC